MKSYSIFFSAFVFFFVLFFRWNSLDATYLGWTKNALSILFVVINTPLLLKFNFRKIRWINWMFLIWGIVAIIAAYKNQNVSFDVMIWSSQAHDFVVDKTAMSMKITQIISYVTSILFFVLYFEKINRIGKTDLFLKYLFYLMLPFIICSDINGFTYHSEGISGYQIGNKFYLCYSNIFLATVYLLRYPLELKNHRRYIKILLLVTFLLSIKTGCSTMIIGTLFYYMLTFVVKGEKLQFLYRPSTYIVGIFICDILFFLFVTWIMTLPIVQYIVVDVLGEDLTLTGRLSMYEKLGEVLTECPLYGFGIGNAPLTTFMYGVGENAQNGLFNMFIESGFIGTTAYLIAAILLIKHTEGNHFYFPIIAFIYMMLLLSTIEVTFTTYFTAIMIMLLLSDKNKKRKKYYYYEKGRNNHCS